MGARIDERQAPDVDAAHQLERFHEHRPAFGAERRRHPDCALRAELLESIRERRLLEDLELPPQAVEGFAFLAMAFREAKHA